MITQVDPSFASYSRLDQVVALIRQNASLEVKLASFKDVGSIQQRCLETEEVGGYVRRLQYAHRDSDSDTAEHLLVVD